MNYIGSIIKTFHQKYPFVIKDQEEIQDYSSIWRLFKGKKEELDISVFILDLNKFPDKRELGRNALKRIKTLRHPSIIKFIDGVETESQIIIATEKIQMLSEKLKENNPNFIVWGLWKIANACKFLNDQGIIHGNLRVSSLFYVSSGEWKLNGLEYASLVNEENSVFSLYRKNDLFLPQEIFSRSRQVTANEIDGYGFGVLIYQIYNGNSTRKEDLINRGKIPINLFEQYKAFVRINTRNGLDFACFIETASRKGGFFDNAIIWTSLFLEEINIKEAREKEEFIRYSIIVEKRTISESLNDFPIEFSKFKVLPELLKAVEYGGAGANALKSTLKLGAKLNHEEFNRLILPTIINLFSVQDNNIKSCLYENLESIISFIPDKIVNDKLFPSLCSGFQDQNPIIREQALKSVLHVAPKLNDRNMNTELFRHLSKLQIDPQPGIRTNATICIGKLSKLFNGSTQKRVLCQTFLRALGDPFPPAKIAGLLAFSATTDYYEPTDISSKILPSFSGLLIDQEKTVRDQAFKNMHVFLKILQKHSDSMPEVKRDPPQSKQSQEVKNLPNSEGNGWGEWALSTVSSKIAGAVLDDLEHPQSSMSNTSSIAPKSIPPLGLQSTPSLPSQNFTNINSFDGRKLPADSDEIRSSSFGGKSQDIDISQNQYSSFNSAAKPLVLSSKSKNGADFGWGDWGNDLLDDPNMLKPKGPSDLGPILQPDRNVSKKSNKVNSKGNITTDWSAGNEDWGWEESIFPKQEQRNTSSRPSLNTGMINIVTDEWNSSPGVDWNSWAEATPSPSQKAGSNDWGSWSPKSNARISIDKIKSENRKQKLQESREKLQSRGKNY